MSLCLQANVEIASQQLNLVVSLFCGIIQEHLPSCFSNGMWINAYSWNNNDGWKNNNG